jgi:hypothetical protein
MRAPGARRRLVSRPNYRQCRICDNWGWSNKHKCPPKWEVRIATGSNDEEDLHRDGWYEEITVYARDEEEAAERAVAKYERDGDTGYEVARGNENALVLVMDGEPKTGRIFFVTGHLEPTYSAITKEMPGG